MSVVSIFESALLEKAAVKEAKVNIIRTKEVIGHEYRLVVGRRSNEMSGSSINICLW